ncbi:GGDEF domain-containing protein [bacterium]|nr:GGDEF domain-containing protein [bacterium]
MIEYKKLKDFFHSLNNCTTLDGVESLISDFAQKDVKLRIFDEIINESTANIDYLNQLNTNLKDFEQFIEGSPIQINDTTIYPILLKDQLIGSIETNITEKNEIENMEIVSEVIALKVDNIRLSGTINKSLEFHNAMKNIAKIIETQYELNYILPIIGEILDTFIEQHLIYIYLKQNGKMKLMWPTACLDDKLAQKISKLGNIKEVSFSRNKKIAYFPLVSENSVIGYVATKSTDEEISPQDVYYLQQLTKQTATTITRAKVYGEILKYATLDALTGFYNRRQLDERVKQEVSHAKRKGTPLCAIMADIDYFKQVNDTYGHAAGDLALKTVSKIMRAQLREYDIAARYGGEEFVILLPNTNEKEAKNVAERLRKAVFSKVIDIEKVNTKNKIKTLNISISLGICEYKPDYKPEALVMNADKALYEAKEAGRNRIVFYNKEFSENEEA